MTNLQDYFKQPAALKQRVLAERLGISIAYMSQLKRGGRRPSAELARDIERETGGAVTRMCLLYPDEFSPSQPPTTAD